MEAVSVVIPTYNRAALLGQTLRCVLAALREGDEIIVVDDGSTDATPELVCAADAPWRAQLRYLRVPNGGAGRARNAGIAAARHDLIAFADSDDEWLPWRLDVQRPVMSAERSLVFCFPDFGQILADGQRQSGWLVQWSEDERSWHDILAPGAAYAQRWPLPAAIAGQHADLQLHIGSMYRQELQANYINVNTLLVRRSVAGAALAFGVDLPTYEDWECFARLTRVGPCAYLDLDTAMQRAHPGPRLTGATRLLRTQTRIGIIERTWARDTAFLPAHGDAVRALLQALRRTELQLLIRAGRRPEARALAAQWGAGLKERAALLLPNRLLQLLARAP